VEVSVAKLTGVVAYVPSDLTLTVRAGTTLAELDAITGEHRQWCPLLAWGDDSGTVGATFATATTGPCSGTLGRPRDLALGVEFVDGTGTVIRGGGRVVKNVAGFDLTRLMVGAFGTLGALTEVTVRLRARPPVDATWLVRPKESVSAAGFAHAARRGEIAPYACEPIDGEIATHLGVAANSVLVRMGGNAALVDAVRALLARDGSVTDADPALWTRLRTLDPKPRMMRKPSEADVLARRIKERFDPAGILNPGLLA
jgi:glycolate oxidase FAD binding subunit